MSWKYTISDSPKTNKLIKSTKINKLLKTIGGTFRNPTTFGDVYNIPPVYVWKDPWNPGWPVSKLRQQMDYSSAKLTYPILCK